MCNWGFWSGWGNAGGCDSGYSCAYVRNISWTSETTPAAKETNVQTMETAILENTLIKLGGLLALGLGEAGVDIVGKALASDEFRATVAGSKARYLVTLGAERSYI